MDMDLQKTMAFILQQQAKTAELMFRAEKRQEAVESRQEAFEKRQEAFEKRQQITERRLEGLTNLVRDNTKAIAELRRSQKETDYKLNALIESHVGLIEAQKKTDEKFERLFRAFLRRQNNGRR